MNPSELFYLAGHCLALDEHPEFREVIQEKVASGAIRIDDLILLCSNHYVLPAFYLKFRDHQLLSLFPLDYLETIADIYHLNRQRNIQILCQIDELVTELTWANIRPVFLKGTANLLDGLYGDIGERMIGDIDFLVKEEEQLKAAGILEDMGYANPGLKDGTDIMGKHHHYPFLTRKESPVAVEIHAFPVLQKYTRKLSTEQMMTNRQEARTREQTFVPSDEHKLLLNFVHAQLSNRGHLDKNTPLRDLYDAFLLSRRVDHHHVLSGAADGFKAKAYSMLIDDVFYGKFNPAAADLKTQRYLGRFNWWMDHPVVIRSYFWFNDLIRLIFRGYLEKLLKSFFLKSYRRYVWVRLSDPEWYKAHWLILKNRFLPSVHL